MYAPMLASSANLRSVTDYLTDDRFVMERKFDGHRFLVTGRKDGSPIFLTRSGNEYSKKVPEALYKLRFEPDRPNTLFLDGELCGRVFYVFDLIFRHHPRPLAERRRMLEDLVGGKRLTGVELVPQAKTTSEKIAMIEKALDFDWEGVMVKQVNSGYVFGGRTDNWLKLKFTTTADCIVTGVRDDGKESVELSLREGRSLVEVGRASLLGKEKGGIISLGDVVEVKYLYATKRRRLYQPRIVRRRTDKSPAECTIDQLKFTSKDEALEVVH